MATRPSSFFRTPYVCRSGWLGVYLDVDVNWDKLADLIDDCLPPDRSEEADSAALLAGLVPDARQACRLAAMKSGSEIVKS